MTYDFQSDQDINTVEVSSRDSETKESLSNEEAKQLVGCNITHMSGESSIIHEIPPFIVDDNIEQICMDKLWA